MLERDAASLARADATGVFGVAVGDAAIISAALLQEGFVFPSDAAAIEVAFKARVDPNANHIACGACGYGDFEYEGGITYTEHTLESLALGALTPSPALFAQYLGPLRVQAVLQRRRLPPFKQQSIGNFFFSCRRHSLLSLLI